MKKKKEYTKPKTDRKYLNLKDKINRLKKNITQINQENQQREATKRGLIPGTTAGEERLKAAANETTQAPILAMNDPADQNNTTKQKTTQNEIHQVVDNYWKNYLNQNWDNKGQDKRTKALDLIRNNPKHNIGKAPDGIIYTDKTGKVMAVHIHIRQKPTVLIAMHLPHTDTDRVDFLTKHGNAIEKAIIDTMTKQGYTERPAIIRFADNNT